MALQYPNSPNKPYKLYTDIQFIALVALNLTLIILYKTNIYQASTIVITYYLQSLLIGLMQFVRLLSLKQTEGKKRTKFFTAFFFAFHFGMFHLVYFIFLISMMDEIPGRVDFSWLGISLGGFFVGTAAETIRHIMADKSEQRSEAFLFITPYLRIVPMHLFIMYAFTHFEPKKFLYFLLLKTAADIISYLLTSTRKRKTAVAL